MRVAGSDQADRQGKGYIYSGTVSILLGEGINGVRGNTVSYIGDRATAEIQRQRGAHQHKQIRKDLGLHLAESREGGTEFMF